MPARSRASSTSRPTISTRAPVMSEDIKARFNGRAITVVSPDVGGVVRARALAKRLANAPLAIVDKRREKPGESEVMNIIGDVERPLLHPDRRHRRFGRHPVQRRRRAARRRAPRTSSLIAPTACSPARAVARVDNSELTELVITDSIRAQRGGRRRAPKIRAPHHRAPARRGDQADRRRDLASPACSTEAVFRRRAGAPRTALLGPPRAPLTQAASGSSQDCPRVPGFLAAAVSGSGATQREKATIAPSTA